MGVFGPPQPRLGDGTRLDDRIGYRFAALLPPDFAASLPAEMLERLADRDVTVVVDDAPKLRARLQAVDAPAVLVRPDCYVLGAAGSLQELNALVAPSEHPPNRQTARPMKLVSFVSADRPS
jgi:3-(3-hydroxy-phenyl)propionate hydroxylase